MRQGGWVRRRGQGKTEYVIITVLVAIALIMAVKLFGDEIEEAFFVSGKGTLDSELQQPGPQP